jgi:GT2 family glycosyltransferase
LAAAAPLRLSMSTISVVIVNYNAGGLLTQAVQAALASTEPVQVVVVDNASSDGSVATLEAGLGHDPRLEVMRNDSNLGFAAANNRALVSVDTPYVLLLNPDCEVRPDTLQCVREVMDRRPEAGVAGCVVRDPDGGEQVACRRAIPTPWRALSRVLRLDRLFPDDPRFQAFDQTDQPLPTDPVEMEGISGAFMFVRREAMEEVGLLDEGYFLHCEDLDWFLRFRQAGWRILFVPGAEVVHAKGACSTGSPVRVLWYKHRGMVRFYRKFFRHEYPLPLLWAVTGLVWLRFAILATIAAAQRFGRLVSAYAGGRS